VSPSSSVDRSGPPDHDACVDWVADFYTKQYEWAGWPRRWAEKDVGEAAALAAAHVEAITRLAGPGEKRILELGAGSGFTSAALAAAGHDVVAVDLVDACVESIGRLAGQVENGSLGVVAGDFYSVDLEGRFDVILLFDGFGIGTDDDQRRLLRRIESWLSPQGSALIDVFAPWCWAKLAGTVDEFPAGSGVYYEEGFDPDGCRMVERMWRDDDEAGAVTQSLRCYAPADLRLLLEATGLGVVAVEPYEDETHGQRVPLLEAMLYLAKLEPRAAP
jgi:SAM-dependent methyltransferase